MNLHTARDSLVHESFPFHPNGTETEQVVVLPAVLPKFRVHEYLSPAGRERWE